MATHPVGAVVRIKTGGEFLILPPSPDYPRPSTSSYVGFCERVGTVGRSNISLGEKVWYHDSSPIGLGKIVRWVKRKIEELDEMPKCDVRPTVDYMKDLEL